MLKFAGRGVTGNFPQHAGIESSGFVIVPKKWRDDVLKERSK
jgi:hypothetical protein